MVPAATILPIEDEIHFTFAAERNAREWKRAISTGAGVGGRRKGNTRRPLVG